MQEAKQRLQQILISWPDNGLALVHYGFVLKLEGDLPTAILYLSRGIETNETGTQDGRFYFHLGDALQRLGRNNEAMQVVYNKLFQLEIIYSVFILSDHLLSDLQIWSGKWDFSLRIPTVTL